MKVSLQGVVNRSLSTVEIAGGLYGLYILAQTGIGSTTVSSALRVIVTGFGFSYFGLSIVAGVCLVRSDGRASGLSKLVQLLQVVQFQALGIRVAVLSGLELTA